DEALHRNDRRGAEDEPAELACPFLNPEDGGYHGRGRPDAACEIDARAEVGHGGRVRAQTPPLPREGAGGVLAAVGRLVQIAFDEFHGGVLQATQQGLVSVYSPASGAGGDASVRPEQRLVPVANHRPALSRSTQGCLGSGRTSQVPVFLSARRAR